MVKPNKIETFLDDENEIEYVRVEYMLSNGEGDFYKCLVSQLSSIFKEYKVYCMFFISHEKTSKIKRRRNQLKLDKMRMGSKVHSLTLKRGEFACVELTIKNCVSFLREQPWFVLSKSRSFITRFSKVLIDIEHDDFVSLLNQINFNNKHLPKKKEFFSSPVFSCISNDEVFINSSFAEIYGLDKSYGACFKNPCNHKDTLNHFISTLNS